jgi:hypothetical protein
VRDGYFAAFRILFCFRFVTRVAGSVDALFAVDFVAFFGVIFFSATWFTSPFALFDISLTHQGHNHTRTSCAPGTCERCVARHET